MKKFLSLLLVAGLLLALTPALAEKEGKVRVAGLIGPTGMSLAPMMAQNEGVYAFTLAAAPEQLVGEIVAGNVDIAAVPTNLAAVLYNRTKGAVQMLAVNTLGVLYVLEKGDTVHTAADLSGKTIVTAGQGAVPEYVLNYILDKNGITDATVEYKSEHNEVNSLAASGMADLVMLPQPMATALLLKDAGFRVALDITEQFALAAEKDGKPGTVLSMGALVVQASFAQRYPDKVAAFLEEYALAVDFVNEEPAKAAVDIVAAGILPSEKVAEAAIPLCNIVFVVGEEMKTSIDPLMEILYEADAKSVGGAVPDDAFYYIPAEAK